MNIYKILFSEEAIEGKEKLEKAGDKHVLKKLEILINELRIHPKKGEGKPKRILFRGDIVWVRRITDKHRLIYDIHENIVTVAVIKIGDHYDDK